MNKYTIRDLELLTGIKSHTIRIWEKRYNLLSPNRTQTNIRLYADFDLKKILNINILYCNGLKISNIAKLSELDIKEKVKILTEGKKDQNCIISQMIHCMLDFDEEGFEHLIKETTENLGIEVCISEIIYPFLNRTGFLWSFEEINPAHEHFASHLIRRELILATSQLPKPKNQITFLLFLPNNEWHEIGLLVANYYLRKSGFPTIYLGQSLPYRALKETIEARNIKFALTFFVSQHRKEGILEFIQKMKEIATPIQLYVCGINESVLELKHHPEFVTFSCLKVFEKKIVELAKEFI